MLFKTIKLFFFKPREMWSNSFAKWNNSLSATNPIQPIFKLPSLVNCSRTLPTCELPPNSATFTSYWKVSLTEPTLLFPALYLEIISSTSFENESVLNWCRLLGTVYEGMSDSSASDNTRVHQRDPCLWQRNAVKDVTKERPWGRVWVSRRQVDVPAGWWRWGSLPECVLWRRCWGVSNRWSC